MNYLADDEYIQILLDNSIVFLYSLLAYRPAYKASLVAGGGIALAIDILVDTDKRFWAH